MLLSFSFLRNLNSNSTAPTGKSKFDNLFQKYVTIQLKGYRKYINKNDLMHFYFHHSGKIKFGLITGFELNDECNLYS